MMQVLMKAAEPFLEEVFCTAGMLQGVSAETREKIMCAHEIVKGYPQAEIATEHLLHGGMYIRTLRLQPGTTMVGSLVQRATVLIVHGGTVVLVGEDAIKLEGYNVLPGSEGRQQVFLTRTAVEMTMIFRTDAKTVEEAENEVFADAELLMSRSDGSRDTVRITGE